MSLKLDVLESLLELQLCIFKLVNQVLTLLLSVDKATLSVFMVFGLSFQARLTSLYREVICFGIRRFVALAALVTFASAALLTHVCDLVFEHLVHAHRLHVLTILPIVPSFHQVNLSAQLVHLSLLLAKLCFQLLIFFLFIAQLLH